MNVLCGQRHIIQCHITVTVRGGHFRPAFRRLVGYHNVIAVRQHGKHLRLGCRLRPHEQGRRCDGRQARSHTSGKLLIPHDHIFRLDISVHISGRNPVPPVLRRLQHSGCGFVVKFSKNFTLRIRFLPHVDIVIHLRHCNIRKLRCGLRKFIFRNLRRLPRFLCHHLRFHHPRHSRVTLQFLHSIRRLRLHSSRFLKHLCQRLCHARHRHLTFFLSCLHHSIASQCDGSRQQKRQYCHSFLHYVESSRFIPYASILLLICYKNISFLQQPYCNKGTTWNPQGTLSIFRSLLSGLPLCPATQKEPAGSFVPAGSLRIFLPV